MKIPWRRKRGWLGKLFCGAVLGLGIENAPLHAQLLPEPSLPSAVATGTPMLAVDLNSAANLFASSPSGDSWDPCAPAWCDPVSRVPNMFGGFFARSLQASQVGKIATTVTTTTTPLPFTGTGAEGGGFAIIVPNAPVMGPKGPYNLVNNIPVPNPQPNFPQLTLPQNTELTNLVQQKFPGVTFVNGGGAFPAFPNGNQATFFYNYLSTSTSISTRTSPTITVSLPDPSGGGLAGRNLYFENGTTLPQDRVYFFYNEVGNFQVLGGSLDINRYVFGFEKTFLDGQFSIEARIPFAGTANHDQSAGQGFAVDNTEFGNVGLAVKSLLYRTANFAASVGLGFSLPTASDSRFLIAGSPVLTIENRTCLLQPLLGLAWAPNDRFYTQAGLQFDLDPSGNPVQGLNANGGLSRIGVLNDQDYAFLNAAAGYWIYRSTGPVTGVALQTELDYYRTFGNQDSVQFGNSSVTDFKDPVNVLNVTPGAIFEFSQRARLSVGVSFPVTGDRLYDWNVTAQLNYNF